MSLVEDSYYDHDEYGRIRMTDLGDEIRFVVCDEEIYVHDVGYVPRAITEPREQFVDQTTPADITIETPATTAAPETPNPIS